MDMSQYALLAQPPHASLCLSLCPPEEDAFRDHIIAAESAPFGGQSSLIVRGSLTPFLTQQQKNSVFLRGRRTICGVASLSHVRPLLCADCNPVRDARRNHPLDRRVPRGRARSACRATRAESKRLLALLVRTCRGQAPTDYVSPRGMPHHGRRRAGRWSGGVERARHGCAGGRPSLA